MPDPVPTDPDVPSADSAPDPTPAPPAADETPLPVPSDPAPDADAPASPEEDAGPDTSASDAEAEPHVAAEAAPPDSEATPDPTPEVSPTARRERPPRATHGARSGHGRGDAEARPRETLLVALGDTGAGGTFARFDAPDAAPVEAAWSGEAVLGLYPDRFTHLHVAGTAAAMEALAARIGVAEGDGDAATRLARALGERHRGVRVGCHVVPDATGDLAALLATVSRLASGVPEGTLSLDVSAARLPLGFALFAALLHADILHDRLRVGSVIASGTTSGEGTSLVDLGAAADLVRWSLAAERFRDAADASSLTPLLPDDDALAAAAVRVDAAAQGATAPALRDDARAFADALDARPAGDIGLDLVRPVLGDAARDLADAPSDADAMLALALRHLRHRRHAAASVVGWEAVVTRVASALGLNAGQRDRATAVAQHLLPEARLLSRLAREATQRRPADAPGSGAATPKRLGGMLGGILSALRTALATADFDARVTAAAAERAPRPAPPRPSRPDARGGRPGRPDAPRPTSDAPSASEDLSLIHI